MGQLPWRAFWLVLCGIPDQFWEKLNRGVSHFFSGKVLIVSRTLSGLFLVGAVNRPRKRKKANREIPEESPDKSGKSRKNRESPKRDKKRRTGPDREIPLLKPPRLVALDNFIIMRHPELYREIWGASLRLSRGKAQHGTTRLSAKPNTWSTQRTLHLGPSSEGQRLSTSCVFTNFSGPPLGLGHPGKITGMCWRKVFKSLFLLQRREKRT